MKRAVAGGPGRGRAGVALAAAALAMAGAGCALTAKPTVVDFSAEQRDYRAQDYREVYRRWTRHELQTMDLEMVMELWATYKSWDFRQAFIARYAEIYSIGDEDRERLSAAEHEAAGARYEFMVTAQANDYRWNDFERKEKTVWRVALIDGLGKELAPEPIEVKKLPDMYEREFFPAKTPFTRTYVVRFARPPEGSDDFVGERSGRIALRFAAPFGKSELVWVGR